jgi:hypothetical protein
MPINIHRSVTGHGSRVMGLLVTCQPPAYAGALVTNSTKTTAEAQRSGEKGRRGAGELPFSFSPLLLCSLLLLSMVGCSATGQSVDALFAAANSQLASARHALEGSETEVGAGQLAGFEFEEAKALLAEAESAMKNRGKETRSLIRKAHAKARLAEALARQSRAETEAMQLEAELEKAKDEANRARLERQSAESELRHSD